MSTLRRMRDDELPEVLRALQAGGSTPRSADSWAHDRMTALLLASASGSIDALMPLARRAIRPTPQAPPLAAGWLSANQFAARMSLRRQTRDTFGEWPALLPDLDALFVVRRDERSSAARWYAQTGFHDVLAIRCLYLDTPHDAASTPADPLRYHVRTATPAEPDSWNPHRWQSQMAAVYRDVYGAAGGAPARTPDFWQPALAHHFYSHHYQFQILGLWTGPAADPAASLTGYAVVGWSGWHSKRPRMDILELATRQWDAPAATALIRAACQLAWSKNVHQVRAVVSAHDPYRGHLARSGFVDRWGYLMLARWLHPQRYLDRLAAALPPETHAAISFEAPGLPPLTLAAPSSPTTPLIVRSDAATLTRLLLNRLDISDALQQGALAFASAPGTDPAATLGLAFPWTPWAFHMLDYI